MCEQDGMAGREGIGWAPAREGHASWDDLFMLVALAAAQRSKDPNTQVGACVVGRDRRILSVGYNGAPAGYDDAEFPWGKSEDPLRSKYSYVVHAEANAILNFRGSLRELRGATVYVTLFPCNECAKLLAQVGVGKVAYLSDKYAGTDMNLVAKDIMRHAGIEVEAFRGDAVRASRALLASASRLSR